MHLQRFSYNQEESSTSQPSCADNVSTVYLNLSFSKSTGVAWKLLFERDSVQLSEELLSSSHEILPLSVGGGEVLMSLLFDQIIPICKEVYKCFPQILVYFIKNGNVAKK